MKEAIKAKMKKVGKLKRFHIVQVQRQGNETHEIV